MHIPERVSLIRLDWNFGALLEPWRDPQTIGLELQNTHKKQARHIATLSIIYGIVILCTEQCQKEIRVVGRRIDEDPRSERVVWKADL